MLENIINQVKGQLTGELQNKFQLQPDTANKSVDLAKDNIMDEVKSRASSGDMSGIMNMLKGGQGTTAEAAGGSNMISKYVSDLTSKLGIPENIAKQVAPFAINFITQKISGKMASDNLGQSDILGGLVGGKLKDTLGKGLGDKLGGMFK